MESGKDSKLYLYKCEDKKYRTTFFKCMVADERAIYSLEKDGEDKKGTKVSKIDTKSGVVESIFTFEDNFNAICLVGNGNLLVLSTKRLMFIDVEKKEAMDLSTGLDISVKLKCMFVLKDTIYLGGISKEDDTFEEMVWTKIQNESVVSLESNKPSLELNLKLSRLNLWWKTEKEEKEDTITLIKES